MAHFSVNNVINTIITKIQTYDIGVGDFPFKNKCHNHFGSEAGNLDKLLKQNEHIYIFYGNEDHEWLTNNETEGDLHIEFWIIDQYVGVDATKSDYQADHMRAYLLSGAWRYLGLDVAYSSMNPKPYRVTNINPVMLLDDDGNPTGYMLTVFKGYVTFYSSMS